MTKNYYDILGVSKSSSEQEIKNAYRKLSKKYHPDMQKGKSDAEVKEAEDKFKDVAHAYEVLSDPTKKENYDRYGDENGMNGSGSGGMDPFEHFRGFNPFGDFNPFGGFGNSRPRQQQAQPGKDTQMRIPVTIEDIFNGCTRTVKYKKKVRCVSCHGAGGSGQKTCPKCHGTGRLVEKSFSMGGVYINESVCPSCGGSGFIVEHKCDKCHGTGFEEVEVTLDVTLPAGIQNTEYVVYENKGSESKNPAGKTGRFIAIADYKIDSDRYEINGLDVVEHVYIPYYKMLLGCSYTLNIPNGVTKNVKIKSCTSEGTIMRLSGEGLRRPNGQHGDYYICLHYQIPESLSTLEKAHLEAINK